jgi:methylphosphotriester-DNA--protein-cysteine methyltransferase
MNGPRTYTLLGADGKRYEAANKGQWGGHRSTRIYGRLNCPAALRAIASGGYTRHRVFFADEADAIAAGYRPCGTCCPDRYQEWKSTRKRQQQAWRTSASP